MAMKMFATTITSVPLKVAFYIATSFGNEDLRFSRMGGSHGSPLWVGMADEEIDCWKRLWKPWSNLVAFSLCFSMSVKF